MKVIGNNIRKERTKRSMSIEEFSEIMQLSTTFIGLIERGQRGVKLANLMKIAEIFSVSVNDLLYTHPAASLEVREIDRVDNVKDELLLQQRKDALMSLVYDFSVGELEFVITAVKGLRTLKRSEERVVKVYNDEDESEVVEYS